MLLRAVLPRGAPLARRGMSIMGAYRSGSIAERTAAVQRLLARQPPPAAAAAAAAVGPGSAQAAAPSALVAVDAALRAPAAAAAAAAPPPRHEVMAQVLRDLAKRGALHRATMKAIEATAEWKGYDGQVTFELMLLRHRYASTDTAMTAARRSQMQAHLRQKQLAVMEEHADQLATKFVASMTAKERDAFRAEFLRLDASPYVVEAGAPRAPSVTLAQMQAALTDVTSNFKDPAFRAAAQWDSALHHLDDPPATAPPGDGDGARS